MSEFGFLDRLDVAMKAAEEAGELILNSKRDDMAFSSKGKSDVVTALDISCEKRIKELIHRNFPSDNILGEEEGFVEYGNGGRWIIDPIDGTNNLVHGIPGYCISIAYEETPFDPVLGVVFSPETREFFHAVKNRGPYLNGNPISVSEVSNIGDAVSIAPPPLRAHFLFPQHVKIYEKLCKEGGDMRDFGSAALHICYVAMGRVEAYVEFRLKYHDYAAAQLILKEAGGCFASLHVQEDLPFQDVLAANSALFPWYTETIHLLLGEGTCNSDLKDSSPDY